MIHELFLFEWAVDQNGYKIVRWQQEGPGIAPFDVDDIRRNGGPMRFYRPLDEPGLWRQFAETCSSSAGVLEFVNEFGLLTDDARARAWKGEEVQTQRRISSSNQPLENILRFAAFIRHLAGLIDAGDRENASNLLNRFPPEMQKLQQFNDRKARYEPVLVPLTLKDALLHQTGEEIGGKRQWRRCRNTGCPKWFPLGQSGHTIRREFCSDRCRVASARRDRLEEDRKDAQ